MPLPLPLVLSFRPDTWLLELSEDRSVIEGPLVRVPLDDPTPGLVAAFRVLSSGGATEDALSDLVLAEDGANGLAPLYFYLQRFAARQLLCYSLNAGGRAIVTLTPTAPGFEPEPKDVTAATRVRLSRFAYCRRDGDQLVVESPLAAVRVTLYGAAGAAAFAALAQPVAAAELCAMVPDLDEKSACTLVQLLENAAIVAAVTEAGELEEDASVPLRQWDFHDLLFHARSRVGRHGYPFGGTFRFLETLPPLPAIKPSMSSETIALPKADLDRLAHEDVPLTQALETRSSVRAYGERPMSLAQLGEFLYRVAAVRQVVDADPSRGMYYQVSRRPYPSGGATYDLELYLSINTCDGLDTGLYHYDPLGHQLERLSGRTPEVEALLRNASASAGLATEPPVLITIASRFQRLSWKYQSMAYAITLKNAGVLYQTMYLVATAMGLAPCGLGGGDADLFARAAGTDYYAETSVGEFMLGSRRLE